MRLVPGTRCPVPSIAAFHPGCRPAAALGLALIVLVCGPAHAEDAAATAPDANPLTSILETLDIKAKPSRAPDFVEATRPDPARLTFIPAGVTGAKRPDRVRTPAEIQAAEAALDAARVRQLNPVATPAAASGKKPKAALAKRAVDAPASTAAQ